MAGTVFCDLKGGFLNYYKDTIFVRAKMYPIYGYKDFCCCLFLANADKKYYRTLHAICLRFSHKTLQMQFAVGPHTRSQGVLINRLNMGVTVYYTILCGG